ncbi:MAG: hypothetical protein H6815_12275 [Phycisphaeraceae bacterium]|nr:hypothetical protein [Phycisphaerales bacterium]MCB9861216.1 hypothetical protein [Phycisphaeraceae bacterium]
MSRFVTTAMTCSLLAGTCASTLAQSLPPSVGADATQAGSTVTLAYDGELRLHGERLNGVVDLQFALFDAVSGGNQLGTTLVVNEASIVDGRIAIDLPIAAQHLAGGVKYLQISVRESNSDAEMTILTPRKPVLVAPVSIASHASADTDAANADADPAESNHTTTFQSGTDSQGTNHLSSHTMTSQSGGFIDGGVGWQANGDVLFYNNGPVGIGTNNPTNGRFEVIYSSGSSIRGTSTAGNGVGVFGAANAGSGFAVGTYGWSASNGGRGVFGDTTAGTGATVGVYGNSRSNAGTGVYGNATSGTGVTYGGQFRTASNAGRGVFGAATSGTGVTYGVYGWTPSNAGRGVFGDSTAGGGVTYGVFGHANSTSGHGVYGYADGDTGTNYGVRGKTDSANGYGGYFEGRGYFSGNVGIGVADPQAELHVAGTVRAGIFDFVEPKLQVISIGSSAFIGSDSSATVIHDGWSAYVTSGTATLGAPVVLPDGATVVAIVAVIEDSSSVADVRVSLVQHEDNGQSNVIATVDSTGSSGTVAYQDLSPNTNYNLIDNESYQYQLHVTDTSNSSIIGTSRRIIRVVVRYTINEL